MDDNKNKKPEGDEEEKVPVPMSQLVKLQEDLASMERAREEDRAKIAGLEEMFAKGAGTDAEPKLREKKNFEPKFRTVRIRKYPIAGDFNNQGYIVGWTNRGAYQEVDRNGVTAQVVDFIDVIFLGQEKTPEGKIKAEKIRLLDLYNKGTQVFCKIVKVEEKKHDTPTGETIMVNTFDPKHGLVATGEEIDGYVSHSDLKYTIQIPGVDVETVIDSVYVN